MENKYDYPIEDLQMLDIASLGDMYIGSSTIRAYRRMRKEDNQEELSPLIDKLTQVLYNRKDCVEKLEVIKRINSKLNGAIDEKNQFGVKMYLEMKWYYEEHVMG